MFPNDWALTQPSKGFRWDSYGQGPTAKQDCRPTGNSDAQRHAIVQADDAKPPCATAHAALRLALTATTSSMATTTHSQTSSGYALGTIARRPHAKHSKRDASHASPAPANPANSTQGSGRQHQRRTTQPHANHGTPTTPSPGAADRVEVLWPTPCTGHRIRGPVCACLYAWLI